MAEGIELEKREKELALEIYGRPKICIIIARYNYMSADLIKDIKVSYKCTISLR